jgi:hypothetical protein
MQDRVASFGKAHAVTPLELPAPTFAQKPVNDPLGVVKRCWAAKAPVGQSLKRILMRTLHALPCPAVSFDYPRQRFQLLRPLSGEIALTTSNNA